MEFEAMGELEYYVIKEADENYKARDQHGYHESAPYAKMGEFRQKCMDYIARRADTSSMDTRRLAILSLRACSMSKTR